ncbi:hypothetical protein [Actinomadura sp. BRA 177]|uniref:hypothetical protein n=1 Tax=Actinomadura sp. BRA 177 TaxID=2745202 RepID=UPI001595FA91|nr:hypothetical protein [Actinomadura sp. BRA 177]NVI92089.1 hypothetical protein [Actinomadura sp. BRA 177]
MISPSRSLPSLSRYHALPPEIGVAAYRTVQEALTNVVKHAAAERVSVALARDGGGFVVTAVLPLADAVSPR